MSFFVLSTLLIQCSLVWCAFDAHAEGFGVKNKNCPPGVPLCDDESKPKAAPPKPVATADAKPSTPQVSLPKTEPSTSQPPASKKPASTKNMPAKKSEGGMTHYEFDKDQVGGGTLCPTDKIHHISIPKTEIKCFPPFHKKNFWKEWTTLLQSEKPKIDRLKEAYVNLQLCLDPCISRSDAKFLSSCVDFSTAKTGAVQDCKESDIEDGYKNGTYLGWHWANKLKRCIPTLEEPIYSATKLVDFVILVDNSGSMETGGQKIIESVVPVISKHIAETKLKPRIILLTQNIGEEPLVLEGSDPSLLSKVKTYLTTVFSQVGDCFERPLEALTVALPTVIRPNANVEILVVTDEDDSSQRGVDEYIRTLQKATIGSVKISSTLQSDSSVLSMATQLTHGERLPLDEKKVKAAVDTSIKNLYADKSLEDGLIHLERKPEKDAKIYVFQNGKLLDPSTYTIDPDFKTIKITKFGTNTNSGLIKFTVRYRAQDVLNVGDDDDEED